MTDASLDALKARFAMPGLRFDRGNGGLTRAVVETPVAQGEMYLHGAHVTGFQPAGQKPVLWMSAVSMFEAGKPIRGGVPICFPWFGPHPHDATAPGHGVARTMPWEVVAASRTEDGGIGLELRTAIGAFSLRYQVTFGFSLQMALEVELSAGAASPVRFEEALHTYFAVSDIHQVAIEGLESSGYSDKLADGRMRPAAGEPIRFTGETDRVYLDSIAASVLRDPVLDRRVTVDKAGSRSTVIWNPWIAKSARMADFGDDEWRRMVCIESANVGANGIELQPGQIHTLRVRITL